jgi:hypothetical protein
MANRQTLAELMASVGCNKYPQRWNSLYDSVMDDYDKNGCIYATAQYYDDINSKYDMFPNYLDDFKNAAEALAKNDALCRAFALLCESMKDRESFANEYSELDMPKSGDGKYHIEYEMLTGLASVSLADYTYSLLEARGLPKEQKLYAMRVFEDMVKTYKARNEGRAGAMSFIWYQLAIDAKLYKTTRLQMEMFAKFTSKATVFENKKSGETLALAMDTVVHSSGYILGSAGYTDEEGSFTANIEETDTAFIGHAYGRYGRVAKERSVLDKKDWEKIIEPGDPVVGVHIPPGGGMTDELISRSFEETKELIRDYFPDFDYKAFICGSWLMDDKLCDLLGEDKNISKFCARFDKIGRKSAGRAVFSFVFLLANVSDVDYNALPENTTLERALKKHYLEGKAIYEVLGYIPKKRI